MKPGETFYEYRRRVGIFCALAFSLSSFLGLMTRDKLREMNKEDQHAHHSHQKRREFIVFKTLD